MINIKIDSRKIVSGDIFVCIVGHNVDGHDYVDKAIENGATKIIAQKQIETSVELEVVENTEKWLEDYLVKTYAEKINTMDLIGVTGTNGKTTTCYLTFQMLNFLGTRTAYIGTIGFHTLETTQELENTTPNILELYSMLLSAKEDGYKCVVMEVSSHALDLGRVAGLNYKVGAFTNLTQDHLDHHNTMEKYLTAKLKLIDHLTADGVMLVNVDVDQHEKFLECNSKTIGKNADNYKIINYDMQINGTTIDFSVDGKEYEIKTNLTTIFNVYNYLTAIAICNSLGSSIEEIIAIASLVQPPLGRAQIVSVRSGIAVVDYAHTPDAVEKIITSFNEIKHDRIITIIGCGGDRDPKKRPIMGNIASSLSDFVVFTNDNPRTEDEKFIMDGILAGVEKDNYIVEHDRRKAIVKALDMIENDDIVLILGKGHEDYQIIGREKIHLSDVEEIENYIGKKAE